MVELMKGTHENRRQRNQWGL